MAVHQKVRQQVVGHTHGQQDHATDQVHVGMGQRVDHVARAAVRAADRVQPVTHRRHDLEHAVHRADAKRHDG
jgi:hypothetical protein